MRPNLHVRATGVVDGVKSQIARSGWIRRTHIAREQKSTELMLRAGVAQPLGHPCVWAHGGRNEARVIVEELEKALLGYDDEFVRKMLDVMTPT